MPSGFLASFPELDHEEALCQGFLRLGAGEEPRVGTEASPGLQRSSSACPVALPVPHSGGSEHPWDEALPGRNGSPWALHFQLGLPSAGPPLAPGHLDRSASAPEGSLQGGSSRYKTELCRPFEESGACKYGPKCQFAHGSGELRGLSRHPKYKTEACRTFHSAGICPYGGRCHFVHNPEERRPGPPRAPQGFGPGPGGSAAGGWPSALSPPPTPLSPRLPQTSVAGGVLSPQGACVAPLGSPSAGQAHLGTPGPFAPGGLRRALRKSCSADSLSDQEDSGSSVGSSGSESPGVGPPGRRLPIFSQISLSDD